MIPVGKSARAQWIKDVQARQAAHQKDIAMDRWHRYTKGGVTHTSVTTAIKFIDKSHVLIPWAEREQVAVDRQAAIDLVREVMQDDFLPKLDKNFDKVVGQRFDAVQKTATAAKDLRDAAGDLGTQIHALIEQEVNKRAGLPVPKDIKVSDRAIALLAPWTRWAKDVNLVPVLSEWKMVCTPNFIGGSGDLLAFANDKLTLFDWKSGKRIYWEAHLQSVGYREMLKRSGVIEGDVDIAGTIVRLPKRAEEEYTEVDVSYLDPTDDGPRWEFLCTLVRCRRFYSEQEKRFKDEGR